MKVDLFGKLDGDAGLDELGEFFGVPIRQSHTAMARRLADLRRLRCAVDTVSRLGKRNPDGANRPVRTRRDRQNLVVVALFEIDLRIIGVVRVDGDALNLNDTGWRRIIR